MQIPMILLIDDCSIKPFLGEKPSGPSYGTTFTSKCKYEEHRTKFKSKDGKEYISTGKVFLPYNSNTSSLSDDSVFVFNNVSYYVKQISPYKGFSGSHVRLLVV